MNTDQVRTMTIGEVFDIFDQDQIDHDQWVQMRKIVALILSKATVFHDTYDCDTGYFACAIAAKVIEDNVDENNVRSLINCIAQLAHSLLEVKGAGNWSAELIATFQQLRDFKVKTQCVMTDVDEIETALMARLRELSHEERFYLANTKERIHLVTQDDCPRCGVPPPVVWTKQ